ncbi:MAG: hypothetical protein HZB50_02925 [Chloroflexi bacterium]|nr:hypothetical protein [Chloroflexota bacterium]
MNLSEMSLRIIGGVMGLVVLSLTLPKIFKPASEVFAGRFKMPGMAIEWVRAPEEAQKIIVSHSKELKQGLGLDTYFIVPIYVLYYIGLAWFLRSQSGAWGNYLAIGVIVCITIAGFFDEGENFYTKKILDAFEDKSIKPDASWLDKKFYACYIKWALIAIVLALTGIMFLSRGNSLAGSVNLLGALIFLIGFANKEFFLSEWGFAGMGMSLLFIVISL